MSCLVFTEKGDEALPVREDLLGPLRQLQVRSGVCVCMGWTPCGWGCVGGRWVDDVRALGWRICPCPPHFTSPPSFPHFPRTSE
jgi:hypothetical protein